MKRNSLFLLVAFLGLNLSAAGDDQPPKDEKKYAPMPWHLVDTWWDIGKETPFESLAGLLGTLRQVHEESCNGVAAALGQLQPVHLYVLVKPGRVEGLEPLEVQLSQIVGDGHQPLQVRPFELARHLGQRGDVVGQLRRRQRRARRRGGEVQ